MPKCYQNHPVRPIARFIVMCSVKLTAAAVPEQAAFSQTRVRELFRMAHQIPKYQVPIIKFQIKRNYQNTRRPSRLSSGRYGVRVPQLRLPEIQLPSCLSFGWVKYSAPAASIITAPPIPKAKGAPNKPAKAPACKLPTGTAPHVKT